MNIVPIEADESEQERATDVMVDSSRGSATAAGSELRVPPAAMAAGDPVCVILMQGLSFPFVGRARVFASVCLAFIFPPYLDVVGTFPSSLRFLFAFRNFRHTSHIFSSTPIIGVQTSLVVKMEERDPE